MERTRSSVALQFYGHYLESQSQTEQAVAVMKRAVELDPSSLIANAECGFAFYCARRFDEAAAVLQKTYEMDRTFFFALADWAAVLEQQKRAQETIALLEKAPDDITVQFELMSAYASAGIPQSTARLLLECSCNAAYVDPYVFAVGYAQMHDTEAAMH